VIVRSGIARLAIASDHLLDTKYFALHAFAPAFRWLFLPEAALTLRCRDLETVRLPCRIVVYGNLPTGVPLAFYSQGRMKLRGASMWRSILLGMVAVSLTDAASAQSVFFASDPAPETRVVASAAAQPELQPSGGFIELLFGELARQSQRGVQQWFGAPPQQEHSDERGLLAYASASPNDPIPEQQQMEDRIDPRFLRQQVAYNGPEAPGTVVIDTTNHFLYLVEAEGRAIRYGVGVGRPGFTWSGRHSVSAKKEWPDWIPPDEMLKRQPYLPHFVAGGPHNPLGARALYLGSTIYRVHGSNEPWTIGKNVSSGCIRMRNADIVDLYERVKVGTKVIVM
jgi:lipoprotein-anchoring transpeptidase ErfK/SrfK